MQADVYMSATWDNWEASALALCVWREARGEPYDTQLAVAYSILNRVARPSWWGDTISAVIFARWQYSSFTDPKDKQLTTWPFRGKKSPHEGSFQTAMQAANDALNRAVANPVPGADSYFDVSIPPPKWATPETLVKQIGRIRFFNLDRDIQEEALRPQPPEAV